MSMNVKKCENGHFYNGDKYQTCPHCKGVSKVSSTSDSESNVKKTSIFSRRVQSETAKVEKVTSSQRVSQDDIETDAYYGKLEEIGSVISAIDEMPENDNAQKVEEKEEKMSDSVLSIRAAVKNVSESTDSKTVGFFSMGNKEAVAATESRSTEPVVGWLVCVKGPHFGECFNIYAGRNSIGRGTSNRIVFSKDTSVSREKHAWITYEPKKREFFVQPGESSGLTYVNDENIMGSKKVHAHNTLEVGESMFLLIPLCGDRFTWEDYMK